MSASFLPTSRRQWGNLERGTRDFGVPLLSTVQIGPDPAPRKLRVMRSKVPAIIPTERIEAKIILLRGQKVMLDSDLASLYGVSTKRLNEQVKRNGDRFPEDFMFQLSAEETEILRSQFATSNGSRGGRRHRPYAFTEHGAVMLASVLNSKIAVEASL